MSSTRSSPHSHLEDAAATAADDADGVLPRILRAPPRDAVSDCEQSVIWKRKDANTHAGVHALVLGLASSTALFGQGISTAIWRVAVSRRRCTPSSQQVPHTTKGVCRYTQACPIHAYPLCTHRRPRSTDAPSHRLLSQLMTISCGRRKIP
nr:hypothetical protein CFP56_13046 [Quercus suber]